MLHTTGVTDAGWEASQDFVQARRGAFFGWVFRRLTSRLRGSTSAGSAAERLACFGEARDALGETVQVRRGAQTVELAKVSGSVGRCLSFDSRFMPVCSCTRDRWERVDRALREGRWLPSVELYKLGDEYFVLDGNHRVSVSRYRGAVAVDAVVTEFLVLCGCTFA